MKAKCFTVCAFFSHKWQRQCQQPSHLMWCRIESRCNKRQLTVIDWANESEQRLTLQIIIHTSINWNVKKETQRDKKLGRRGRGGKRYSRRLELVTLTASKEKRGLVPSNYLTHSIFIDAVTRLCLYTRVMMKTNGDRDNSDQIRKDIALQCRFSLLVYRLHCNLGIDLNSEAGCLFFHRIIRPIIYL